MIQTSATTVGQSHNGKPSGHPVRKPGAPSVDPDEARRTVVENEDVALGDMILSKDARDEAAIQGLGAVHFLDPTRGVVCTAILDLHAQGEDVDAAIVADQLRHTGQLDFAGGAGHISSYAAATPGAAAAGRHIANVIRAAGERHLARTLEKAMDRLAEGNEAGDVIEWVKGELQTLGGTFPARAIDPSLVALITAELGVEPAEAEVLALELGQKVQRRHLDQMARRTVDQRQAERDQRLADILPVRADMFIDELDDPVRPLLGTLMSEGHNLTITAKFKVGKTKLVENAIAALVTGLPFLDSFAITQPRRVVLVNYELTPADQRARLRALGLDAADLERLTIVNLRGRRLVLTSPAGRNHLVSLMAAAGAQVLVLDTWGAALSHCGLNENENTDAAHFTNAIDEIKQLADCPSALITSHTGRARHEEGEEHGRGATRLDDWADVRMVLTKDDTGARFVYSEGRATDLPESRLRFDESTGHLSLLQGDVGFSRRISKADGIVDQVVHLVAETPGLSKRQVEDRLRLQGVDDSGGRNAAREAIGLAERRGRIHHHKGDRNAHLLHLGAVHTADEPCPDEPIGTDVPPAEPAQEPPAELPIGPGE